MQSARSDWSKYCATKQMITFSGARRESEALSCNRVSNYMKRLIYIYTHIHTHIYIHMCQIIEILKHCEKSITSSISIIMHTNTCSEFDEQVIPQS